MTREFLLDLKKKASAFFFHEDLPRKSEMIFILTAYLIGASCNYFYQIYVGRVLGPDEYGIFGALFSIIYLIYILGYTIQTGVAWKTTRILACSPSGIGRFVPRVIRAGTIVSLVFFLAFLIISPDIGDFIHFSSFPVFFLLGMVIILTFLLSITSGIIQGLQRQIPLSLLNITTYLPKLLFAVIFLGLGWGLTGALLAQPIGMIIAFIVSGLFLLPYTRRTDNAETDLKDVFRYIIPTLVVMICLAVPSNVDVIIAKNLYSSYDAGLYVSASILGKIVLFVSATITILFFPKMSQLALQGKKTFRLLNFSLLYTFLLSGPTAIFFIVFPDSIRFIFGPDFSQGAWIVQYYAVLMLIFSLIWVSAHYSLAVQRFGYAIILSAVTLAQIVILLAFRPPINTLLNVLILGNLLLFITGYVYLLHSERRVFFRDNGTERAGNDDAPEDSAYT